MNSKTVIIGAGFAGRQACRALYGIGGDIVLLDPNKYTVMLPALPDLAGGWIDEQLLFRPIRELLPKNIQHLRSKATSIDLDARTVTTEAHTLKFDHLLITCGSVTDFHGFDQHLDQLYRLDALESALRIRESFPTYLKQTEEPHLVLAGGGYTGLELAASLRYRSLAENKPCKVTVIDPAPDILPFLPESKRDRIKAFLKKSGITILNDLKVSGFDGQNVTAGEHSFTDVFFCWTGGSTLAIPDIKGSIDQLRDGRIKVAPDLSLPGYPNVFAAGDAAAFEQNGNVLRKAVNFSWYEGLRAGKNIARCRQDRPTRPFRPIDLGWVIPLHGESVGKIFSKIWVYGTPGLRLHYFMCGFRNYSLANFAGFAKKSLTLFRKESPQ